MAWYAGIPTSTACRASTSASMSVAPHEPNSFATVDLPLAMLPVSPTRSIRVSRSGHESASKLGCSLPKGQRWQSQERDLVLVDARHLVAVPAPCLVRLTSADHDRRRIVPRRSPIDDALVSAGRPAADHADRVQLVDELCVSHELRHGAERLPTEVGVRAGDDHAQPTRRKGAN